MKLFKYILLLLAINFHAQPNKLYNKIPVKNNCLAQPVGTLVYNDFNSASWTYTGTGAATYTSGTGITLTGGVSSVASNLLYTAMATNLNTGTITTRVQINAATTAGVFGIGVFSTNSASLRHYAIIDCRVSGGVKGNLMLFYDNAFSTETQPTVMPFTNGDVVELQYMQSLLSYTLRAKNVTQASSYVTTTKALSVTFGSGSQDIPDVVYMGLINYSGTLTVNYFKYESDQKQYADLLLVGDSKTHGFYAQTQANRYMDIWSTNTKKSIVNVAAQSNKLENYVLLNNLIYKMKPKAVLMCAAFRNNISASTFNATAKGYYLSITQNANRIGAVVYHLKPLPEGTLDQSTGLTYITQSYCPNKILDITSGFVSGTHNSDGTHPNVSGNALLGANATTVIPKYFYKN